MSSESWNSVAWYCVAVELAIIATTWVIAHW
jgi:hypothetical protein